MKRGLVKPHFGILVGLICLLSVKASAEFVYGVNCGGPRYIDTNKNVYHEDNGFELGEPVEEDFLTYIKYTTDSILFQSGRTSRTVFTYKIPVTKQGHYFVVLRFAETEKQPTERVFQVGFGEIIVYQEFDIASLVGRYAAVDVVIEFFNFDNLIFFVGEQETTQLDSSINDQKIMIHFIRSKDLTGGQPKINAIALYHNAIPSQILENQMFALEDYQRLHKAKMDFLNYTRPDIFEEKNVLNYLEEPLTASYVLFRYPLTVLFCSMIMFAMLVKLVPKKGQLKDIEYRRIRFDDLS